MSEHYDSNQNATSRRQFIQAGIGVGAAGVVALGAVETLLAQEKSSQPHGEPLIKPGDTILFQGDSITDASRKKDESAPNSKAALGNGYAWLAAAQLLVEKPDADLKIFNRGISGNKVHLLAERWKSDCLDLKPDVLSILIGVNDYWHKKKSSYDGTVEVYEKDYRALVKRTKDALPDLKFVICEPFVLETGAVEKSWIPEFEGYRAAARRVASEAGAVFVPFQAMFDAAAKLAPPNTWAADGVHPTASGAALMAFSWLKAVGV